MYFFCLKHGQLRIIDQGFYNKIGGFYGVQTFFPDMRQGDVFYTENKPNMSYGKLVLALKGRGVIRVARCKNRISHFTNIK